MRQNRANGTLQTYRDFSPTPFDARGLAGDRLERNDWLVAPCSRNRDSDALQESNFDAQEKSLAACDPTGEDHEIHRFGHWGNGWFEIVLIRPGSACENDALELAGALEGYPVLDDHDFSEREHEEADRVWRDCYDTATRVKYIRAHRSQFEFRTLADLIGCVRGKFFAGYTSELIS